MAFENTKASFVAGIVVVITILNDAISLLISISRMVEWMKVAICLLLVYLALGTKKLNHILNRIVVEKFGSFLTVYSVIIILLEKTLISQMANIASCGGFDIFAVILNKKFRFSIATVLNICDAIVILIQAFGNPPIQTLCGILVITISARVAGLAATLKNKGNMCADLSY